VEVSAAGAPPLGLADVLALSDGSGWVAWIAEDPAVPNGRNVLVARSADGELFDTPIAVDGDLEPAAIWPRIPRLSAAGDGGVLLAFATVTPRTESLNVYRAAPGARSFEHIFRRDRTTADDALELLLPLARTGPAGATWVAWLAAKGQTAELWLAREEDGWAEQRVDVAGAEPACTCCPIDLAVDGDRALFAWRGGSRRELLVREATATGFLGPVEISNFGLVFLACPLDGPVIRSAGGLFEILASDTDPAGASLWSIAESSAGSWLAPAPIPADPETGGRRPSRADDGETTWLAYDTEEDARLASRAGGVWTAGAPWPTAAEPIRLASGGGQVWAVRVDEARRVWLVPLTE
jgi:hypothetical protein